MSNVSSDDASFASDLLTYSKSGIEYSGASSLKIKGPAEIHSSFLTFLAVAQTLNFDFLPITWQPELDVVGQGATARIWQALVNLQMTFAFKRPRAQLGKEAEMLRALTAEISILGHPSIRDHPAVVKIEGICWDLLEGGEAVMPVLIFEKTKHGDLKKFITEGVGSTLSFREKLELCFDIGLAIRDMHVAGVIHGDIKPQNILIFESEPGNFAAKVTDFGYSTIFNDEDDIIRLPWSQYWNAPEWHHRGFTTSEAKSMDTYSFGMVCLWSLFYDRRLDKDLVFNQDVIKVYQERLSSVSRRCSMEKTENEAGSIWKFFQLTLANDPGERTHDFEVLLHLLVPLRFERSTNLNGDLSVKPDNFRIARSVSQLIQAHYRVRSYIATCLSKTICRNNSEQSSVLQLALCYHFGFVADKDVKKARDLLQEHGIPYDCLENEIGAVKELASFGYQQGNYNDSLARGHFPLLDMCDYYRRDNQLEEAEQQFRREISSFQSCLGPDHLFAQDLRRQLSILLSNQGRWKESEELQICIVQSLSTAFGEKSQLLSVALSDLAKTYHHQGCWSEAEQINLRVLDIDTTNLGREDYSTLTSTANLALTYLYQGRLDLAEKLEAHALNKSLEILGPEHNFTLNRLHNYAAILWSQGRRKEAKDLQEQVLKRKAKIVEMDDFKNIKTLKALASSYWSMGLLREAEEHDLLVLAMEKKIFGEDHPDILFSMANLASTYQKRGRWKEAEELLLLVLRKQTDVLGEKHPKTLISMSNLASIYKDQGRWQEAEALLMVTIEASREQGEMHLQTISSRHELASTYIQQGRWDNAKELLEDILKSRTRVLGASHPETLAAMNDLASTFMYLQRLEEAEVVQRKVYKESLKALGEDHPSTQVYRGNLGSILCDLGRLEEAEELQIQCTVISRRCLGAEHPDTLISINNLADIHKQRGRINEAQELQIEVKETSLRVLGREHPFSLLSMNNLAATLWDRGQKEEARNFFEEVLKTRKRVLGDLHPDTLASISDIAYIDEHWQWQDGAINLKEEIG